MKRAASRMWEGPAGFFGLSDRAPRWQRVELISLVGSVNPSDPISDAVIEGLLASNAKRRPNQDTRGRLRALRATARADGGREAREAFVREALTFVRSYPSVEEFQKVAAKGMQEASADVRALEAWLGVSVRFPNAMDAFHNLAILTHRVRGAPAVRALLQARFNRMPRRLDQLLVYAETCDLAGATAERRSAFDRLATIFGTRKDAWLLASSWLEEEFGIHRLAVSLLRRFAAGTGLGPPIIRERERRLNAIVGDWERSSGSIANKSNVASVRVLGALFDRVAQHREKATDTREKKGSTSALLLTGSLGAGGAERQLVATAVGLNAMSAQKRRLGDGVVLDEVVVIARSLRDRKDGSFFLGDLNRAGLQVQSYREFPDFGGSLDASAVRPALSALGFLPWSTAEAVIKLTDSLRVRKPEVVHIWQDGLVYAAGLAALLAGVPRVVLSGRSAPPPDRRARYPIEYDIIYKSLMRAPGVRLSVNSHYAAKRYASWLNIDPQRISVVPNGVSALPSEGDARARLEFQAFEARTGLATFTLGGVMRLDEVKRPLLWIDAAAAVLAKIPRARIVIVGDGPFRPRMERRAESLGIKDRCLFAGRSTCVGYWLSKMDTLMLLSEFEGLPNVLIEAQLAGVPVVTSAAGGAPETLIPGKTGAVVGVDASAFEVSEAVARLATRPEELKGMGVLARQWAGEAFPIQRMLSKTLDLYGAAGWTEEMAEQAAITPEVLDLAQQHALQ